METINDNVNVNINIDANSNADANNGVKSALRRHMRMLKSTMTAQHIEENSRIICEKLCSVVEFRERKNLFIYVNYNQEVITRNLIQQELESRRHRVFVPKTADERRMYFCHIDSIGELVPGAYGILEPRSKLCISDSEIIDADSVIILPGLAFDTEFNRIGYGGGYYDTFLEKHKGMFKIALCHDFQITDTPIQAEDTDIKADMIISEKRQYIR